MTMHRFLTISVLLGFLMVTVISAQKTLTMRPRTVLKPASGLLGFSPDGRMLATRGSSVAQLWDSSAGGLKKVLLRNVSVNDISFFSPDWQTVATWSWSEKTIRLWSAQTEQLKATLEHEKFSSVVFSPDGRTAATASLRDLRIMLWDVATGRLEGMLIHPKPYEYANGVGKVAFSPDGKILITSSERTVYLWDVADAKLRIKLIGQDVRVLTAYWRSLKGFSHGDTIYDLVISPDGNTLATASRDGTAKLWNIASGELRAILKGHKGRVHRLTFSRDGRTLATGSDDKTAKLWDVVTGQLKSALKHRGTVWSIDFNADGKLVATAADNDHSVKIWDVVTGHLLNELKEARSPARFSPDGRTLATAGQNSTLLLWDVPAR